MSYLISGSDIAILCFDTNVDILLRDFQVVKKNQQQQQQKKKKQQKTKKKKKKKKKKHRVR